MTDIVERLRLLVPSDSSGAAFDAVNEITRLIAEVEDLSNRLHHVHRLWANNEHALRAEVERLRAALSKINVGEGWAALIARAALEEKLRAALESIADCKTYSDRKYMIDIARAALNNDKSNNN